MHCIVCGSEEAALFTKKSGHDLFSCSRCGLVFVHPLPSSTREVYGKDYFEGASQGFGYVSYDEDKEPMVPAFRKYLTYIEKSLPGTGSLLDVGAATGFFVALANQAGFKASGIEISDHAASLGREKGLTIRTGVLSDVSGAYDCITMLDVIEHVPDPRADIRKAASLLRTGGIIVINTPDAGSLFARTMGKHWHLIVPPEHLFYFNRSNMHTLLESEGFEQVLSTTIGKSFTPQYILKMLYKWTKIGLFNSFASRLARSSLGRISIPVNLRDNMFVLARKKHHA